MNSQPVVLLRAAKRTEDPTSIINLISLADFEALIMLSGQPSLDMAKNIYIKNFASSDAYCSYKHVLLCTVDNAIAGCVLAYPGSLGQTFRPLCQGQITPCLGKECEEDEFYIDSLAVDDHYRGHGIASKLLLAAKIRAKKTGQSKMSLLADKDQPKLQEMYSHLGFNTTATINLAGHMYHKMIQPL